MRTTLFQCPKGINMPVINQKRFLPAFLFSLIVLSIDHFAVAQSLPSGFSQVQVAGGISSPTVMAFAPDGRIFVAQQNGQLRIIKNGSLLSQPFLSLPVSSSGERGLLGIAFDPGFSYNQYIYLYYTVSSGDYNRISRFTANGDVAVAGSEQVILNLDQLTDATNHNGGTMMFGPDGKLYVGVGENAYGPNAQNNNTYHGKLLRINPDGSVPPGNPFAGGAQQQRIWASGLRNPYTIAFQPGTGRLFVNDVGGSESEEINDATAGGKNFGWPNEEGFGDNSHSDPVYAYGHGSGCAISGGTFFNPSYTNYPSTYIGRYFYIDYCGNWIDMLSLSGSSGNRSNFAGNIAGSPVSLTTGTDGNLYFLSRDNNAVYKIVYAGGGSAPVITSQPKNVTVAQGANAVFSVTATGTAPVSYQWRKNGVNINGATAATYTISNATTASEGTYSVVVSNATGSVTSSNATLTVTIPNQPPVATITSPAVGATYAAGNVISFSGTATDPENGTVAGSSFIWYVIFHHDTHTHPGPSAISGATSGSFTIPTSGETATDVFYRLYLVVTDLQGARDTTYRDILPRTSTITLNTNPQGLMITLDGQPFTAPLTVTSVEGIVRTIGTTSPQSLNSNSYNFNNWSHGGTQNQSMATPVNNVTYTATFIQPPVAPSISTQPGNMIVVSGLTATFRVVAGGTAPLSYQWRKNGVDIAGGTSAVYTISSVTVASAGIYSVVVSNAAGAVTSNNATLTVATVPVITGQPENVVAVQGSSAAFIVTATGTAPLTYQWRRNGVNIPGPTGPSFNIQNVSTVDAGTYSVAVSNAYGTATSNNATLTVTTAPVITSQPEGVTTSPGSSVSFSVAATGTAPLSYQWKRNGINIAGATSASFSISSVSFADAGAYSVVVSNAYGSATSSNATLSIEAVPNLPPVATITLPATGSTYAGGDVINYSGTGTDPDDGSINQSAFTWFVIFYHDEHGHPGPSLVAGESGGSFTIPNSGETAANVFYRLHLVVTDEQGLSDTAFTDIYPRTSLITFNTSPQGLNILVDGELYKTPITITSVEGIERTIGTPSPQAAGEAIYYFSNWTHGGDQSQIIVTPAGDTSFTAVFTPSQNSPTLRDPDSPVNPTNGLDYSYYHGTWVHLPDFSTLYKQKVGTVANFDLSPRTENSNFAFRFEGFISVPADAVYTFHVASDDGSKLYIGDSLIVQNDSIHTVEERAGQIGLKAGLHRISVEFFENTADQFLSVSYEGGGISKQPVPGSVLFREQPIQYVFNPIADTYVRAGNYMNVNMYGGAAPNLLTTVDNASGDEHQTYLRFDISSLGNDISSAKLRLYGGLVNSNNSPAEVGVYNVPDWRGWLENTITFSNKPVAEGSLLAAATVSGTDSIYYEWDLTQLIARLRQNDVYYVSLILKNISGSSDDLVSFLSRENESNRPELVITTGSLITEARPAMPSQQVTVKAVVSSVDENLSFSTYPNPVRNSFTIKYPRALGNTRLRITDISGLVVREVLLSESGTQTVNAENLKEGFYILSIYHKKKRYAQKIFVSR